jgi:alginate O-acetyltransferase complex protein AlgI
MLFNSPQFCAFFVIVTTAYYLLPWRRRWQMLLAASCYFYMSFVPAYILILLVTIALDYYMGLRIADSTGERRRVYLWVSIVSTCLVLFVFKYYNFFVAASTSAGRILGMRSTLPLSSLILPIGLSFHTFQSLSYVVEVYRGRQRPERHFGIYALYVMFYPQLVAGPIERPQNLLHQFYEDHAFRVENVVSGLSMMAWGYFQKMVIADRAAQYVNLAYGSWQTQSGLTMLMATVLFAIQIYADFAGYSSIAIGAARVMGFELMTNFRHPYFASSIGDFWHRWHISLSTWFKDYVYIPLGGSRVSVPRRYLNLLITFTISGLWHGANWTFVIWGLYNGMLLVAESTAAKWWLGRGRLLGVVRRAVTLVLILIGWVFFRAPSLESALGILHKIALDTSLHTSEIVASMLLVTGDNRGAAVMLTTTLLTACMFAMELRRERHPLQKGRIPSLAWQSAQIVLLFQAIMLFGVMRASTFIYFQF